MPEKASRAVALSVVLLAGACTQSVSTRYPSLLPRAIERRGDAEPAATVAVAAPDPALDATLARSLTALKAGRKDFATAAVRAETLARAARGAAVGSDRWLDAQTALAELDALRAGVSGLVTDLDDLSIARAADGKPAYPALDDMRAAAQAELDAETAVIARVQASLPAA